MIEPKSVPSEVQIEPPAQPQERKHPSILLTICYAIFLAIVPGFVVGSLFGIYAGVEDIQNVSAWFAQVDVMLAMTFTIYFLVVPSVFLFSKWSLFESNSRTISALLSFAPISLKQMCYVILSTTLFWLAFTALGILLELPEEPFMMSIKASDVSVAFVILTVCILAPVVEELVFRGFLFARLEQSKIGLIGAAVTTSVMFAAIHSQYTMVGICMVFLLGAYFTWMRIKYRNVVLCMWAHGVCNLLTMVALYQFT
ncbi:CPBP family intramembrane glutamic endopeptidase [Thalassotalea euphylliae]|uniref:CPBP family intramembrane glutamic endopeptidase n=1 Tax=Thalassotalea euphylliae TaxID=1655234 RepID=UPI00363D6A3B